MAIHDVRSYGAVGDGVQDDTLAIRAAIDACRAAGGGTVYLGTGTYLSGTLVLCNHLTLHIDAGATLLEQYQDHMDPVPVSPKNSRPHLLYASAAHHIALCGHGCIVGRGASDRPGEDRQARGFRSGVIFFEDCTGVRVHDITIRNGDAWTVHLVGCQDVFVRGVSILNNLFRRGGNDGLDLNSCRNVFISDCRIEAWDDCIVLKTRGRSPADAPEKVATCENVVVTNCVLRTGCTALKIGSESAGDFRDIHFSNCVIRESSVGFGIYLLDGATVERVSCSGISMEIISDTRYRVADEEHFRHIWPVCIFVARRRPDSRLGRIRDLSLRDIHARSDYGAIILGDPASPIEELAIDGMTIRVERALPYAVRQLPCAQSQLESQDRIERPEDWWRADAPAATITACRPGALPPYQPAYLNIDQVRGLSLSRVRVLVEPDAIQDNEREGIVVEGVCDATATSCGVRSGLESLRPLKLVDGRGAVGWR